MRILISGATGLIGTELTALLRSKNIDIHYLTLHKHEIKNEVGYNGFLWNPLRGEIDENCMIGVDAIIHLAGAPISKRWTTAYKQEIIESRTMSANLFYKLLKCNPHQVKQFVSASAIGIYADSLNAVYTEDSKEVDDSFLGNVVVKWENSANKLSQLGIRICKIRTGLVLSAKGGVLAELMKPVDLGLGSPFGSGKQWQSWIHIDDLTSIYYSAIINNFEGVINGTAPNPVTNEVLIKAIARKLAKPFFMPNIPRFAMKFLLGEMHILLFASQNVVPKRLTEYDFTFKYPTLGTALTDLLPEKTTD